MGIPYNSPHCGFIELHMEPKDPKYILELLPEEGTLVEWGCGGSTVYFLDNLKEGQTLVTIEHRKDWYDSISNQIKNHPNLDSHVFLFVPSDIPNNHFAKPEEETPCGLADYICPDVDLIEQGDVFFVNGVARGAVVAFLSRRARQDAHVILHDFNSRVDWYGWAVPCFDYSVEPDDMIILHLSNTQIDNGDNSEIQPENDSTTS